MPRINQLTDPARKELAAYIDGRYGNGSKNLSIRESNRALQAVRRDRHLQQELVNVLGEVPRTGRELVRELFEQIAPPSPGGGGSAGGKAFGARPGSPGTIFLQADGTFSLGQRPAGSVLASAPALYEAALLLREGGQPFARLNPAQKARVLTSLQEAVGTAVARAERERVFSDTTRQLASGAATMLVALAEASTGPVRGAAVAQALELGNKFADRGLKASIGLNLQHRQAALGLDAATRAQVDALLSTAVHQKPDYDAFIKNGQVFIRQYIHEEFYDGDINTIYKWRGYREVERRPSGSVILEGEERDPTGKRPPLKVRVEVEKVSAYGTDRKILEILTNDDKVSFYTGHSSLGGNIHNAIRWAARLLPSQPTGFKWLVAGMCRGTQNLPELAREAPNLHVITTAEPAYASGTTRMCINALRTMAMRGTYADCKAMGVPNGEPVYPHELAMLGLVDADGDGHFGGLGGAPDPVYDIHPRLPPGQATDMRPGPAVDPADVDGGGLANAIAFVNTLFTYHAEHSDGRTPHKESYSDKLLPGGYFHSKGEEFLQVSEEKNDGETFFRVAVNSRYANQSESALAMRLLYELNGFISKRETGEITLDDKLRGLLLASEWIAYMVGPGQEANALVRSLGQVFDWPVALSQATLAHALEQDTKGYGQGEAVDALKRALGPSLGDGARIA